MYSKTSILPLLGRRVYLLVISQHYTKISQKLKEKMKKFDDKEGEKVYAPILFGTKIAR